MRVFFITFGRFASVAIVNEGGRHMHFSHELSDTGFRPVQYCGLKTSLWRVALNGDRQLMTAVQINLV